MAEVVFFHHALGLTAGVHALADRLRDGRHVVHTPDLFEGRTFATVDEGVAHARALGWGAVVERGRRAAEGLPGRLVLAGASLGVLPATALLQRPGTVGALFLHGAVPPAELGVDRWPAGVPLQVHAMADDDEGDVEVARDLVTTVPGAELFLYPGDRHLFTDDGCADFDATATDQVVERALRLLDGVDAR